LSGSTGNTDYRLSVSFDSKLQLRMRSGSSDVVIESDRSLLAEEGERGRVVGDRITVRLEVIGITASTVRVIMYQSAVYGLDSVKWRVLHDQVHSVARVTSSGDLAIGITDDSFLTNTRFWGIRIYENGSVVANLEDIPGGQKTFSSPASGGTWGTLTGTSELNAEWLTFGEGDLAANKVIAATWSTGKQEELSRAEASTAKLVITNDNRHLDPDYASSPFSGDLLPRVPIRILYNDFVVLWRGFVESGWKQVYRRPETLECEIECIDLLGVIADAPIVRDQFQSHLLLHGPSVYLTYDNLLPSGEVINLGLDGTIATYDTEVATDGSSAMKTQAGSALQIDRDPKGSNGVVEIEYPHDLRPMTYGFFVKIPEDNGANNVTLQITDAGTTTVRATIFVPNGGGGADGIQYNATSVARHANSATINDNVPYFVIVTVNSSGNVSFRINNAAFTSSGSGSVANSSGPLDLHFGSNNIGGDHLAGTLDETFVIPYNLFSTEQGELWDAIAGAVSMPDRIDVLMWSSGVPDFLYEIEDRADFVADVGEDSYGSEFLLDELAGLIATEQGGLYFDHRNNVIKFHPRPWRDSAPPPQEGISDVDGASPAPTCRGYNWDITPNNLDNVINTVELEWLGNNGEAIAKTVHYNLPSIERYGSRRRTIPVRIRNYSEAELVATAVFDRFAEPTSRVNSVSVDVSAEEFSSDMLFLEFTDTVSLTYTPGNLGASVLDTFWVNGTSHTVSEGLSWETKIYFVPRY